MDESSPRYAAQLHGAPEPTAVAESDAPRRSRRRWRRWVLVRVFLGVLVGVAICGLFKLVNDPVISKGSAAVLAATATPKPDTLNTLAGLNIEMKYPGIFDEVARINTDHSSSEQYNISSKAEYGRSIAVSVHSLPSGKLDDDSSYKFRLITSVDYKLSTDKIGVEPVALMTKNDHTERTLFWAHAGHVVIVAITSTASKDNVNAFMATVMPTLRWRE